MPVTEFAANTTIKVPACHQPFLSLIPYTMNSIIEAMNDFLSFDPRESEKKARTTSSAVFLKRGEEQALKAFQIASRSVPAYKDFLKKNEVDPGKINTFEDFKKVPLTGKKNYLLKYRLEELLVEGKFFGKSAITSSSGSLGNPFYWPRMAAQDFGAAKGFETFLSNTFDIDTVSTLHINCSGMGVWTAGDYFSLVNKYISYKYPHNSSISPGIDLDNTSKIFETLSPFFGQTILYSYPPFAKDIVDNLPPKLIRKINLKLVVFGEPYTEKWRMYMLNKICRSQKHPYFVSSLLGSSEVGLIGSESKACTMIRVMSQRNKKFCRKLFGETRVPSLVQYNPASRFVEIVGNNIVLTNIGGLPLIRYDTHDYGGVLLKEEIAGLYKEIFSNDMENKLNQDKISMASMPCLYVFGRADYTVSIYGVLIYPETIKDILSSKPFSSFFSGKFVMSTQEDSNSNQRLKITLETKKSVGLKDVALPAIEKLLAEHLKLYSSEYAKLLSSAGQKVFPKVGIRSYGDDEYFSSKNKQKYLV